MKLTMVRMVQSMLRQCFKLQAANLYLSSVRSSNVLKHTQWALRNYGFQACSRVTPKTLQLPSYRTIYSACRHCNSSFEQDQATSDGTEHADRLESGRQEVANLLSIGWHAPETISDRDLDHFLTLTTKKSRKKFLRFLSQKEILKKKEKLKRKERARERTELKEQEGEQEEDNVFENRLFLRLHSNTILQFDRWRLAAGMKFGPKLVFDFSYEELMRRQEIISMVQQLTYVINANKFARDPFSIHWVGLTEDKPSLQQMKHTMKDSFQKMMVNVTDKDLFEAFPKKDLIYLSADSPNIMKAYDPDKTYVIGALVDSSSVLTGQSLARAKRHGIEHARLPLDKHLQWTTGAKTLTLDQMMKIMIEMNTSGDWVKALQHVPIRKHSGLRSGAHWDQLAAEQKAGPMKRRRDSIQRNPSHFVSSRAGQSKTGRDTKNTDERRKGSSSRSSEFDDDDDKAGTFYSSKNQSGNKWFD